MNKLSSSILANATYQITRLYDFGIQKISFYFKNVLLVPMATRILHGIKSFEQL